jgi:hypothetical protein
MLTGRLISLAATTALTLALTFMLGGDVAAWVFPSEKEPLCERPFARGEWGTDVLVQLRLSRPPAMGQSATVFVDVCAKRHGPVRLIVTLPESFAWVQLPPGLAARDRVSPNPANFGCLHEAQGTVAVAARVPFRLTGTARAQRPGPATLIAGATPQSGLGDSDYAYLTVGRIPESSHFGFPRQRGPYATTTVTAPPTPMC